MKTIAQQLNIKEFPFEINDKNGKEIYFEDSDGDWWKKEYKDGNEIYYENSDGYWWKKEYKEGNLIYFEDRIGIIEDYRPKKRPCVGKKVTIDGVDYELK